MCNHRPKACPERGGGNERQRIDGGVASGLLIFPSTPQSPCGDSSPSGEPFSTVQAHCTVPYPSRSDRFNGVTGSPGGLRGEIEISPGPLAKKGYNVALGSMFVLTPSENSLTANFQLPLRGSLLVYFINSCDKPPSPREEDFAKQKTEGVGFPPQFSPNR